MMSPKVILYDLPSKQGVAWSPNSWKTRMILNYKGIPYTTQWIEYPDLAPTLKSLGLPPNPKDNPGYFTDYSSPAVRYVDGSYAMDSWPIAHELEKRYPEPSLELVHPVVVTVRDLVGKFMAPLRAHIIPKVPLLLPKQSEEYFYRTRKMMLGKSLQEVASAAGEANWEEARAPAKELGDLLRKHEGPFYLGQTVSYADFIFVSALHFCRRADVAMFERVMTLDPTFEEVYEASKQWLERDI